MGRTVAPVLLYTWYGKLAISDGLARKARKAGQLCGLVRLGARFGFRSWKIAIGVRGGVFCFYSSELLMFIQFSFSHFRKEARNRALRATTSDLFPLATERKEGRGSAGTFYDIPTKRKAKLCSKIEFTLSIFTSRPIYIYIYIYHSQPLTGYSKATMAF